MNIINTIRKLYLKTLKKPENEFWGCGVILQNCDNKLLVSHRVKDGKYGFIGGGIETGENPIQAIIREVKEETGIDIEEKYLFYMDETIKVQYPEGQRKLTRGFHFFYMKPVENPIPQPEEVIDFKWVMPLEYEDLDMIDCSAETYALATLHHKLLRRTR